MSRTNTVIRNPRFTALLTSLPMPEPFAIFLLWTWGKINSGALAWGPGVHNFHNVAIPTTAVFRLPDRFVSFPFDSSQGELWQVYEAFPADKKNAHRGHWNLCPEFMPLRRFGLHLPGLIIFRWNATSSISGLWSWGYWDNEIACDPRGDGNTYIVGGRKRGR